MTTTSKRTKPEYISLVATYNEDGSVHVEYCSFYSEERCLISLDDPDEQTIQNIEAHQAFTIAVVNAKKRSAADLYYKEIVAGNNDANAFEKSGLTAIKSEDVDAPIIKEFPISMLFVSDDVESLTGEGIDLYVNEDALKEIGCDKTLANSMSYCIANAIPEWTFDVELVCMDNEKTGKVCDEIMDTLDELGIPTLCDPDVLYNYNSGTMHDVNFEESERLGIPICIALETKDHENCVIKVRLNAEEEFKTVTIDELYELIKGACEDEN